MRRWWRAIVGPLGATPAIAGLLLLFALPRAAEAQETTCDSGDLELRSLSFSGNAAFTDDALGNVIVNTPSDRARRVLRMFGTRRCLDRAELPRDVLRLILFYRNHGYYEIGVDTVIRAKGEDAVSLTFRVREGQPTLLDSLDVSGLAGVPDSARLLRGLPVRLGRPFDKALVEATRDTIARRLRDRGYPRAEVLLSYDVDRAARRASASYAVIPGHFARFGDVRVVIVPLEPGREPELSKGTVRGAAGIRRGGTYRESALETAKRNLYRSEAYRHVEVAVDTTPSADSVVNVLVQVDENYMHAARLGAGWGTLDCFRTQAAFVDRDFLNGRGRLELNARLSKVGIGKPLDLAPDLCPGTKQDTYRDTLNYFVGATLRQPIIFGLRTIPSLTLYSERRSEFKAFVRTTPIGGVASFDVARRRGIPPMNFAYQLERGRTTAEPALFCAVFNLCTEADRDQVQQLRRLAVLSWSTSRDRTNDPVDPTRGTIARLEVRHALSTAPFGQRSFGQRWLNVLGSSDDGTQFNRFTGDGSWYRRIGDVTLATRLRIGAVLGNRLRLTDTVDFFVPPQERLYTGGPNSVRGFRQNELGPAVYVLSTFDTVSAGMTDSETGEPLYYLRPSAANPTGFERAVPIGGNSVIMGTVELRVKSPVLPGLIQWALFEDFGQVWNRGDSLNFAIRDLKLTPGAGVRIFTPIGAFRMDVGYNPYRRPAGAAYYDAPLRGATAPLFCVSPGNTLPARQQVVDGQIVYVQEAGACPGSFQPERGDGFLRRLTFNFSLGQAF